MGASGLALFALPFVPAKMHHFVGGLLVLGSLGGLAASVAGSSWALGQTHVGAPRRGAVTYSPVWIGLAWGGAGASLLGTGVEGMEWFRGRR